VSDETLGRLFEHCLATVFPSLYEGLGLPVLESYWFGRPALASDTSALKELVPPSCRFDPTSAASIAQAMLRFHDEPAIGQESLAYAARALATYRWTSAARAIADWVDEPLTARQRSKPRPLLVAASLPPAPSGVAFYTQRSLCAPAHHPVTFFAPAPSAHEIEAARTSIAAARHELQREPAPVQVLPTGALHDVRTALPSDPVLFVLGNSDHHCGTVAHLLTYGARPTDLVHLHDIYIGGLLAEHFDNVPALTAALMEAYDQQSVSAWIEHGRRHVDDGILGARLLAAAAGVRRFLVNSSAAKDRLEADLGEWQDRVSVDVAFLPILQVELPPVPRDPSIMRIGHFGIVGRHKQPDRLIEACDILASRQAIQVLFAGYGVSQALHALQLERPYIVVSDSPDADELQRLMNGVDCAVQLRYPDHGESSGVINQLLALRRPVVCTRTGSSAELEGAVTLVPPDVTPDDLASAIVRATSLSWSAAAERLLAARTPEVFEERIREILAIAATA
jgi:glycosyltransferase involved in cell wall biosynthesis